MLKSVTAINHRGDVINMELGNPYKTGFAISNITGIGPPTADVNVTDLASIDGGYFNSARAQTRNIVMSIIFVDDASIETIRQKTYRYFPVKKPVTLIFEADNRTCGIQGYVESNGPEIFSNQESTQISILCPQPYFYDAYGDGETKVSFSSSYGIFEFPFSNEITENEYDNMAVEEAALGEYHTNWQHIEFGIVTLEHQRNIVYEGEADTGFLLEIIASGTVTGLSVFNALTEESITIKRNLTAGDTLQISTISGQKYARILRNGRYTNVMNYLDRDTSWFKLVQGDNLIGFTADSGENNIELSITYKTLYEGV